MTKLLLAVALLAAGCSALPREELAPSERGEVKTGTNISREREMTRRESGPTTSPIAPSAPAVGAGGSRGG